MHLPLTPLEFKRRAVRLFGPKVGIIDGEARFTYEQFGQRTNRLAHAVRQAGLAPGDRVALLAFNCHPLLEAYFGVLEAGCVLLPVNVRLSHDDIAYVVQHAGAKLLIADRELADAVDAVLEGVTPSPRVIWIGGAPPGHLGPDFELWIADASPAPPPPLTVDENAVAELFYTSGTTARPRGVMLTHRNLYLHAMSMLVTFRACERDVQLHTIPLFHVNGWGTPQSLTAVGATHVLLRKFDPEHVLRLIEEHRVTRFFAVPTMLSMLLEHPDLPRRDLSSLELINTGGAATPPDLVRRAERAIGCRIIGGYGLTETSPIITFAEDKSYLLDPSDDDRIRRRASTGLPVIGTEIAIVDDNGRELPWDGTSVGEVVVRGHTVTPGYWNDDAATAGAIRDGRLHTGDLATIDPEGYVLIVDRKKDIIISGGENISSLEVEKALCAHPAVLECAVVAMPHEHWGEVPHAVVALREGQSATEEELVFYCREHLAAFKIPKSVSFWCELPKGGTGKILKRVIRDRLRSTAE